MLILGLLLLQGFGWHPTERSTPSWADSRTLVRYINEERVASGLPPLVVSSALTKVAQAHVRDLEENRPDAGSDARGRRCTMHSWSDVGNWTPVCFTADNEAARLMWSKPREITRGAYRADGFEIAYRMPGGVDAETAIGGWLESPRHLNVFLEQGVWRNANWAAIGVAIQGDYAVAWFGKERDDRSASKAEP